MFPEYTKKECLHIFDKLLPKARKIRQIAIAIIVQIFPDFNREFTQLAMERSPLHFGLDHTHGLVSNIIIAECYRQIRNGN